MSSDNIRWPYGLTGEPYRARSPLHSMPPVPGPPNETALNFAAGLSSMSEPERREFMTWLQQMLDYYGIDSATAIERGVDTE